MGFRSPLLTQSQLISFPLPTKMFQSGRFLLTNVSVTEVTGCPIKLSPHQRLLAPTRSNIAAWHDLLQLSNRAIHQTALILAQYSSRLRMQSIEILNGNDHGQSMQINCSCLRSYQPILFKKLVGELYHIMYSLINMDRMGFEPMASCLQSRRSSADLPAHILGPAAIE